MDSLPFISAFVLGLMGAGHCLGMCGGITAALSFAIPEGQTRKKYLLLTAYNIGRITSYAMFGALVGFLGAQLANAHSFPILKLLSGGFLILMGLYLAEVWRVLSLLENIGSKLWAFVQPLGKKLMPVTRIDQALLLGGLWGWLPCGLVYSAVVYASAQASALSGAGIMLAFGLGTMPAVFIGGVAGQALKSKLQNTAIRRVFAVGFILFGVWTLWANFYVGEMNSEAMMCH